MEEGETNPRNADGVRPYVVRAGRWGVKKMPYLRIQRASIIGAWRTSLHRKTCPCKHVEEYHKVKLLSYICIIRGTFKKKILEVSGRINGNEKHIINQCKCNISISSTDVIYCVIIITLLYLNTFGGGGVLSGT